MDLRVRPFQDEDLGAVVELSLVAWAPVFAAWERILGPKLFPVAIYPDWREGQKGVVERVIGDEKITTWVAEVNGRVVGFVAYEMYHDAGLGEVQLLAVHPEYQNQGIGTRLNVFALEKFREKGMKLAAVGTGGDEGHAPARRSYEKAGYTGLPVVRYYQDLRDSA